MDLSDFVTGGMSQETYESFLADIAEKSSPPAI
jgi:hypothetical protein